jgi:hypothetical protein
MKRVSALIAAMALPAAAPAPAPDAAEDSVTRQMVAMFVSACLDGQLRLSPDQGRQVSWRELSSRDRDDAKGSKSARYFKIVKPVPAMLVMADYDPPAPDGTVYLCMIDRPLLKLKEASRLINESLRGLKPVVTFGESAYEAFVPKERLLIYVSRTQMALSRLDQATADRLAAKVAKAQAAQRR